MVTESTAERVLCILARELGVDRVDLQPGKLLREDLGVDSIVALNLLFALERELGLTVREEELVSFTTVADLERFLNNV